MSDDDAFDAMIDACCEAYKAVMQHGTAEMRALARALLYALGRQAAHRAKSDADGRDD